MKNSKLFSKIAACLLSLSLMTSGFTVYAEEVPAPSESSESSGASSSESPAPSESSESSGASSSESSAPSASEAEASSSAPSASEEEVKASAEESTSDAASAETPSDSSNSSCDREESFSQDCSNPASGSGESLSSDNSNSGTGGGSTSPAGSRTLNPSSVTVSHSIGNFYQVEFNASDSAGSVYTYYITGFTSSESATACAENILSAENGKFVATEAHGLIDAEKYAVSADGAGLYADENLCWAGSTSDMLYYSGWTMAGSEDAILDTFAESFTDDASVQQSAITWYMNGVNTEDQIADWAHLRDESKRVGNFTDYCADDFVSIYEFVSEEDFASLFDKVKLLKSDSAGNHSALGITFGYYLENGSRDGGHCVTVAGYATDADGNVVNLVLADSDNDAKFDGTRLASRGAYPDSYTIYNLMKDGNGRYYIDYYPGTINIVDNLTVLKEKKSDAELVAFKETQGTKDVVSDFDFIFNKVTLADAGGQARDTFNDEESVRTILSVINRSYKSVAETEEVIVPYRFCLDKDGSFYAEQESYVSIDGLSALSTMSAEMALEQMFDLTPGQYSLQVIVNPYENEYKLSEAYYRNNSYQVSFVIVSTSDKTIVVPVHHSSKDKPSHELKPTVIPEKNGAADANGNSPYVLILKNFTATNITASCDEAPLDDRYYKIVRDANGVYLQISPEYMKLLGPGKHIIIIFADGIRYEYEVEIT